MAGLTRHCAANGLDLLQPLQAGWYNERVNVQNRIIDFGADDSLVVLIGNTAKLWPALINTLRQRKDLLHHANPLDTYVEETISAAVDVLPVKSRVRWAHRPQPHHIAIQQMAEIAGLAWRSPAQLSIHPKFGPWIGLRAAVVLAVAGPATRPVPAPACTSCSSACMNVLEQWHEQPDWQDQLAVRDACPIGRQYRYSENQIAYHYQKSKALLRQVVDETHC